MPSPRPTLLITRPREDSESLAEALQRQGWQTQSEPLLRLRWLDGPELDMADVQALLFTSANGVRAFARRSAARDYPVLAVGDGTARTARALDFSDVSSASGDVEALTALVRARCAPTAGRLLHVAGTVVAGDLAGRLANAGFAVDRAVLYAAETAQALSPEALAAIRDRQLFGVLAFSPRTARTCVRLLCTAGLAAAAADMTLYGLSPAVADAATHDPLCVWGAIRVAAHPDIESLLSVVGSPAIGGMTVPMQGSSPERSLFAPRGLTRPP